MNNQRRMFRGRAGPTDGRLPKHNARRRRNNQQQQNPKKNQVPSATFNLIKAIIGSGVLALPSGVAAMSDRKIT